MKKARKTNQAGSPKEKAAETTKFEITEWERVGLSANHTYVVLDESNNLGLLTVDGNSMAPKSERSLIIQTVDRQGEPGVSYRDDAVVVPIDLRRLIVEERLRRFCRSIRDDLCASVDPSDNPELAILAWCQTLEDGFAGDEMNYLLEDMAEHGSAVGLGGGDVKNLKAINVECEELWPDRVERRSSDSDEE